MHVVSRTLSKLGLNKLFKIVNHPFIEALLCAQCWAQQNWGFQNILQNSSCPRRLISHGGCALHFVAVFPWASWTLLDSCFCFCVSTCLPQRLPAIGPDTFKPDSDFPVSSVRSDWGRQCISMKQPKRPSLDEWIKKMSHTHSNITQS